MNDVFLMVIVIVTLGVASGMFTDYQKTQRQVRKNRDSDDDLRAELDALQERVIVLEEIVTDRKYQLKRELDSL